MIADLPQWIKSALALIVIGAGFWSMFGAQISANLRHFRAESIARETQKENRPEINGSRRGNYTTGD